ncbi:MAG: DUF1559 family PulG-like putative transporter [Planctomycetota bacterium]|jgi:prepilin-type processing-associated H-X9-DG protein
MPADYPEQGAPAARKGMPVWGWVLIGCGGAGVLGLLLVALLIALMVPAVKRTRENARRATCKSNLRQIGLGCHMYADDNGEQFPPDLGSLTPMYIDNPKVFWCPSCGEYSGGGVSYKYLPGRHAALPGDFVLAYDADSGNHSGDGFNVLYCDAHVEWRRDFVEFEELVAAQTAVIEKMRADPKNRAKYMQEYRELRP